MNFNPAKNLIVIAGPTAVGKTSLSIKIAQELGTEIVSADSRQFYKELKIGTAAPSEKELALVPHHFIGNLSIHDYYNVSIYENEAIQKINELFCTCNNVVVVGGSGLFIQALLQGIDDLPDPDENTRLYLKNINQNEGINSLRLLLKHHDPEYYQSVDLANPKRLIRALEVCLTTGKKFSDLRLNEKKTRNFNTVCIALFRERAELNEIISNRTDQMIAYGLEEEARNLYPYKHLNALNTVGYKEFFNYFDNIISREEALEKIKTNTRRYAKRQVTWFKKKEEFQWFYAGDYSKIFNFIMEKIK